MNTNVVRFVNTFVQGSIEIWVDTHTGVNYILCRYNGVSFTPLLGSDGKPVISTEYIDGTKQK